MPPAFRALLAQIGGWTCVWLLGAAGFLPPGIAALLLLQAVSAAVISHVLGSPRWWLLIHLCFSPLLFAASKFGLPPAVYLVAFVALSLIYWTSFRTQVPLFLSNAATVEAIAQVLPDRDGLHVLDIGSGTGSFLRPLARHHPHWQLTGIEAAPGPYWLGRWQSRQLDNVRWIRGNFLSLNWHDADVVYAFLSPVPMLEVWEKARTELRPGSLLISNSFPVPELAPEAVLDVNDRRQTRLFIYRIPGASLAKSA